MKHVIALAMIMPIMILTGCRTETRQTSPQPTMATTRPSGGESNGPNHVPGLEKGWQLVPSAQYAATQSAGAVTITATGENPTAGYETKLVPSRLRIWPPRYLLAHKKPEGLVAQVITKFQATASFKTDDPVEKVIVTDGAGEHEVTIERPAK